MKESTLLIIGCIFCILLNSCSVVGGIFKTGMGFGIFLAIIVVAGIILLITRSKK
jgi:hypothetical protein